MSTEQATIVIPSSPADQADILRVMRDISDSMLKIEAQKAYQKDEIAALAEKYDLPKKYLNKMARTYHKNSYDQDRKASEDFSVLYETVTKQTTL